MLGSIEIYQRVFSQRLSPCRFYPSCSAYGYEAISVHGARRGLWLTIKRFGRCRPFGPSGIDLVPTLEFDQRGRDDNSPSTVTQE